MTDNEDRGDEYAMDAGTKKGMFLNNLESWIGVMVCQNGLTDKQVSMKIKQGFRQSLQANIEYHYFMARNIDDKHYQDYHLIMARIYKELAG
jgi:hypothetical protein